jgi:hypothetical protein
MREVGKTMSSTKDTEVCDKNKNKTGLSKTQKMQMVRDHDDSDMDHNLTTFWQAVQHGGRT